MLRKIQIPLCGAPFEVLSTKRMKENTDDQSYFWRSRVKPLIRVELCFLRMYIFVYLIMWFLFYDRERALRAKNIQYTIYYILKTQQHRA